MDAVEASYEIRIVSRPGVQSGVWRYPENNRVARNHYIIVEAVDSSGRSLRLPIASEETGQTRVTAMWGLRVPESVYQSVRADKTDDGIIQNALVGRKAAGRLNPEFLVETTGGAITDW